MKAFVYDLKGKKVGDVALTGKMFESPINVDVMHRAVVMRLSNARNPIAHTKTRGEVNMTTKKAFKQKGTGRARRGALSTNLLRGGGVTHGPRNTRNFTKMMPKKERRLALFSALTVRAQGESIVCLRGEIEVPSTKVFAEFLSKAIAGKKCLLVFSGKNATLMRSARNIPSVTTLNVQYLNPKDILQADVVCFTENAFEEAQTIFTTKK